MFSAFIVGLDVRSGRNNVSAEIHKLTGADISLYYNKKLVRLHKLKKKNKFTGGTLKLKLKNQKFGLMI